MVEPKLGVVLPKLGEGVLKLGDGVLKLGEGLLKLGDGVEVSGGRLLFGTLVLPKLGGEPNVDPGVVGLKPGVVVWAKAALRPSAMKAAHGRILAASMLESPLG